MAFGSVTRCTTNVGETGDGDVARRRAANLTTTAELFRAVSRGDRATVLASVTDDVVYDAPWYDLRREGWDELEAMLLAVAERFDSVRYEAEALHALVDPDLVVAEVRSDHAVAGSERRYRNVYVQFLRFRDGRVCEWREYSNPDAYRAAVDG